ncbi:integrase, catalytic region, zinc finger, CCHC-type containing protein [Tanacetum coccineum]
MMLDSIDEGPLVYPTIVGEDGQTRPKKYSELTEEQQLQDDCDVQATNIILHDLPPDVYLLVNHQEAAKDIWDRVKLLMKGTELSYQERECKLYKLFDKFASVQDYGLAIPTFQQGEDPIDCINKEMAFLFVVASRFPSSSTKNSFAGTENRGIATNLRGNNAAGQARVVECYNCQGEGHMAKQFTQPKRPRNSAWFKEKMLLVKAQEAGQILDEEQLAFTADPRIVEAQDVQEMPYYEQTHIVDFPDNEITSDSYIIPYSQYLQESQDAGIQDTNSYAPNDLLAISMVEQMANHVANLDKENQTNKMVNESLTAERYQERESDTLNQTLSNHVKEKESSSTTLIVFKTESKEKESKYIDKEIVLEKQNKELENILLGIEDIVPTLWSATKVGYDKDALKGIKHWGDKRKIWTLKTVCDELHHRILNFRLGFNKEMPRRKWSTIDRKRSELMVDIIDKQMRERRILRNLERLVGARELEMDYRPMTRTE